jgi:hypothetical protein
MLVSCESDELQVSLQVLVQRITDLSDVIFQDMSHLEEAT